MAFRAVNPTTGALIREVPFAGRAQQDRVLDSTVRALRDWLRLSSEVRARPLTRLAALFRERSSELALLMAEEMGKPVRDGRSECHKCASAADYFAQTAPQVLRPVPVPFEGRAEIHFEALGVILLVMPWNFPFWQVIRAAVPAIAAGNTVILKHAPNVPGCALAAEQLFLEAGFPPGVFTNLFCSTEDATNLIADDRVAGVSLTGSTRAGRSVARAAGQALKKCVLELGGSDPYIVLGDADLDAAALACATGRLINGGQSCIAAKRFLVVEPIQDAFVQALTARLGRVVMGDPTDERTELGPLARSDLRETLHRQVEESVAGGARLLLGGKLPAEAGYFYPATVLDHVRPGMPAFDEETFGPVAAIVRARHVEEAVALANQSRYGLGGAVFSQNEETAWRLAAEELSVGSAFVNSFVRSDPRLPFGGVRESGFGRELARQGLLEFVNVKTVARPTPPRH